MIFKRRQRVIRKASLNKILFLPADIFKPAIHKNEITNNFFISNPYCRPYQMVPQAARKEAGAGSTRENYSV